MLQTQDVSENYLGMNIRSQLPSFPKEEFKKKEENEIVPNVTVL